MSVRIDTCTSAQSD